MVTRVVKSSLGSPSRIKQARVYDKQIAKQKKDDAVFLETLASKGVDAQGEVHDSLLITYNDILLDAHIVLNRLRAMSVHPKFDPIVRQKALDNLRAYEAMLRDESVEALCISIRDGKS